MEQNADTSLEQALARTESDADQALKAAEGLVRSLRKLRAAARTGDLRDLHASIEGGEKALAGLRQQFANTREGWRFDEQGYFEGGGFVKEVLDTGNRLGLRIVDRDDRLYCYPSLLRVSAGDRSVYIDKKREARVRPTVLVAHLKELQRKPPRFRPDAFLASLHAAYAKVVAAQPKLLLPDGPVVPLVDLYELLTLLPGQTREYSRQEFARDVYLLHRSGVDTTRNGDKVSFPASTGTRAPSRTISVITEAGEHRPYYGISFTPASREA